MDRSSVELVIDPKTGRARQAGTVDPDGKLIDGVREKCEKSLFAFAWGVMQRTYLTNELHRPVCDWLTEFPPYRKLLLLPRRHAKTSIVAHALPLHILIQPAESNIYLPGQSGRNTRIMLAGEVEDRASDNLRVIRNALQSNMMLRALWPEICWENPKRQADKWNETELVIPRDIDYPDPSIRAIGVGGAITGARHDVHIKDDLVSEAAANSETVMQTAIRWHKNSRALFDDQKNGREFIIGTKWAVNDLYQDIMENDPTVEPMVRSVVEDGRPIYPQAFDMETIEQLQHRHGSMFWLMYMNSVSNPELVDFSEKDFRYFSFGAEGLVVGQDRRDVELREREEGPVEGFVEEFRGARLTSDNWERIFNPMRDTFFRARYG